MSALNAFFDRLPRSRVSHAGREWPVYRTLGVAGFFAALIAVFAAGFLTGRSLLVIAGLALVCACSFYGYAYLRLWITGQNHLVLLEHVWTAVAASACMLWALREPVLPYLDIESVGICAFLAAGRLACTLVGCCHGKPASFGVCYPERMAEDGFPAHLAGVRLFPVPAIEMSGLVAIGVCGFAALPFAPPGHVLLWFGASYAVLRFGLEALRGDRRPQFLGLSLPRWMALVELAAVLWWTERDHARSPRMFLWPALLLLLVIALVARHRADASRRILCRAHIQQLRSLVIASRLVAHGRLEAYTTSRGVRVAVSEAGSGFPTGVHVSLSLVDSHGNLPALAQLAGGAFPRLDVRVARYTERRVLHVVTPVPTPDDPPMSAARADLLYGNLVRHFQGTGNAVPEPPEALDARPQQQWYFAAGNDG